VPREFGEGRKEEREIRNQKNSKFIINIFQNSTMIRMLAIELLIAFLLLVFSLITSVLKMGGVP
jgi:hypothetical protein